MSAALLYVLLVLATYRAWRFVFVDDLPPVVAVRERFSELVFDHFGAEWADGIHCPWCSGWWVSCAVVTITWTFVSLPLPGLWYLAVAAGVALVGSTIDDS